MTNVRLTDDQWNRIHEVLRQDVHAYVGDEAQCRRFVEGVLWVTRSGAQWRLLPREYGAWNSVYKRFARWCDNGVWDRLMAAWQPEADMENGMIDSTVVRAHPCAAGAPKKTVAAKRKGSGAVAGALAARCMLRLKAWAIRFEFG
jgi:transposase